MADKPEVGRLVRAIADDDQEAWNELVRRFANPVMAVIRSYRLTPADAEDQKGGDQLELAPLDR